MYDRLGGLVPRLALTSHRPERRNLMRDALAGLRAGMTVVVHYSGAGAAAFVAQPAEIASPQASAAVAARRAASTRVT